MHRIKALARHLQTSQNNDSKGQITTSCTLAGDPSLVAQKLIGRAGVITGSGSGIGRATAILFAKHGARVVIVDINEDGAKETTDEINETFPGAAVYLKADVSVPDDVKASVAVCVENFGRIDYYYANAGVLGKYIPIEQEEDAAFERALKVNTLGPFMAIKYASKAMKQNPDGSGGSIICTASIAALRSDLTPLQYAASKGAVISMVISANDRLMLDGIRINAIVPGGVMTPMVMGVAADLAQQGLTLKGFNYAKFPPSDPSDIANVALFLASDDSVAIKGQHIIADGGMTNSMSSQPAPSKIKPSRQAS